MVVAARGEPQVLRLAALAQNDVNLKMWNPLRTVAEEEPLVSSSFVGGGMIFLFPTQANTELVWAVRDLMNMQSW